MKLDKNKTLNAIAIFIIILSLIRIYYMYKYETLIYVFWLCDHTPLIAAIAILFRNRFLLLAEYSLMFLGMANWIMDFIFKISFDRYFLSTTPYLETINFATDWASGLLHFTAIPLLFWAIFIIKNPPKNAWIGSLIHAIILIPIIIYFKGQYNLNCFLEPCVSWLPKGTLYPLIIFILYIGLVALTNQVIYKIIPKD